MISSYQSGQEVHVKFPVPTLGDQPINYTAVFWKVTDETGAELVGETELVGSSGAEVTVEIPASANTLTDDNRHSLRVVSVRFETAEDGSFAAQSRYAVEAFGYITPFKNSFQSYDEAVLTRLRLPKADGWDDASEREQKAALVQAYQRICRLNFRYREFANQNIMSRLTGYETPWTYIVSMKDTTLEEANTFPQDFRVALRTAQVIEADKLLAGDPIEEKRLSGIVSESIGESKIFLKNSKPLEFPVGKDTLDALAGYFHWRTRVGRG